MTAYVVTTCAGRQESLKAESADAARLLRLDQIIEALEWAEAAGVPRRFDWHALPRSAEEYTGGTVHINDLYPEDAS